MSRLSNAKNLGRNSWRIEGNHYQTMKWEKAYIKFEPNIRYTGNDETEYEKQQQYVANGIDADLYKEIYSRNMDTRRDYGKLLFRNQLEGYFRLPFAKTPFSFEWNLKYDGEHKNETITDTLLSLKTRELRKDLKPTGELTSDFNISKELKSWKGKSLSTTLGLKYCYNYFRATGERLRMQADSSMPDEEWIVMGGDSYNTIKYHHNHGREINIDVHEKHGWNLSTKLRGGYIQRGIHDVRSFIHSRELSLGDFEPSANVSVSGKGMNMWYMYYKMRPDMVYLLPVTDNRDLYDTWYGNPDLKNGSTHILSWYYNKVLQKRQQLIGGGMTMSFMSNGVRYSQSMNQETGVVVHIPRNVNGEWKLNANVNYGCRVDKQGNVRLSSKLSFLSQRAVNFSYDAELKNSLPSVTDNFSINGDFKLDYLGIKPLRASAIANIKHSLQERRYTKTHVDWTDYTYGLNVTYAMNKHLNFSTDIMAYTHSGYVSKDMNTTEWVWNASASYSFGKQRDWSLRAVGFDLLGQLKSQRQVLTEYGYKVTTYNTLPSYATLYLSYRFNSNNKITGH